MSQSQINLFVGILKDQGISILIVRLNTFNEWSRSGSGGVSTAKQIIDAAYKNGINVAVDLHSWFTTWDNYFDDNARGHDDNRQQYISHVRNVINDFQGHPVHAFMVMNEPQAQNSSTSEDNFIFEVLAAAKNETNIPVSVRFMGGYSPTTGHYSAEIDQMCDFICRNTYWDPRNPSREVYGSTEQKLLDALRSAHASRKEFWVTEFGKSKRDLTEQRNYVRAFVEWAKDNSVDAVFCWASQPSQSGENYNIFTGFEPHPAFYELTSDGAPPPEPKPEPPLSVYDGVHARMFPFPVAVARMARLRDIYERRHAWFRRIHELLHPLI